MGICVPSSSGFKVSGPVKEVPSVAVETGLCFFRRILLQMPMPMPMPTQTMITIAPMTIPTMAPVEILGGFDDGLHVFELGGQIATMFDFTDESGYRAWYKVITP